MSDYDSFSTVIEDEPIAAGPAASDYDSFSTVIEDQPAEHPRMSKYRDIVKSSLDELQRPGKAPDLIDYAQQAGGVAAEKLAKAAMGPLAMIPSFSKGAEGFSSGDINDSGAARNAKVGASVKSLPFFGGVMSAAEAKNFANIARRFEENPDQVTQAEMEALGGFVARGQYLAPETFAQELGSLGVNAAGLMVEMASTGGLSAVGRGVAGRAAMRVAPGALGSGRVAAAKMLGGGIARGTAAAAIQTPGAVANRIAPTADAEGNIVQGAPLDSSTLAKAFTESGIDAAAEIGGAQVLGLMGKLGKKVAPEIADKIAATYNRVAATLPATDRTVQKVFSSAAFNGIGGEFAEERVGELARMATGGYLGDAEQVGGMTYQAGAAAGNAATMNFEAAGDNLQKAGRQAALELALSGGIQGGGYTASGVLNQIQDSKNAQDRVARIPMAQALASDESAPQFVREAAAAYAGMKTPSRVVEDKLQAAVRSWANPVDAEVLPPENTDVQVPVDAEAIPVSDPQQKEPADDQEVRNEAQAEGQVTPDAQPAAESAVTPPAESSWPPEKVALAKIVAAEDGEPDKWREYLGPPNFIEYDPEKAGGSLASPPADAGLTPAAIGRANTYLASLGEPPPPPSEGMVRMYRGTKIGETPHENAFFTDERGLKGIAVPFARAEGRELVYVDVPKEVADARLMVGAVTDGEYSLPAEYRSQVKRYGSPKPVRAGQYDLAPPTNDTPSREATVPGPQQKTATDREEFLRDVIAVMRGQPSPEFTPNQAAVQAEAAKRGGTREAIKAAESEWQSAKAEQSQSTTDYSRPEYDRFRAQVAASAPNDEVRAQWEEFFPVIHANAEWWAKNTGRPVEDYYGMATVEAGDKAEAVGEGELNQGDRRPSETKVVGPDGKPLEMMHWGYAPSAGEMQTVAQQAEPRKRREIGLIGHWFDRADKRGQSHKGYGPNKIVANLDIRNPLDASRESTQFVKPEEFQATIAAFEGRVPKDIRSELNARGIETPDGVLPSESIAAAYDAIFKQDEYGGALKSWHDLIYDYTGPFSDLAKSPADNIDTRKTLTGVVKSLGYDGYRAHDGSWVPFDASQVIQKTDELYQEPTETGGFYSKLDRVVGEKVKGRIKSDQLLATLKNNGVTDEEIRDRGLVEFVKSMGGVVTRDQLDKHLADKPAVNLKRTELGGENGMRVISQERDSPDSGKITVEFERVDGKKFTETFSAKRETGTWTLDAGRSRIASGQGSIDAINQSLSSYLNSNSPRATKWGSVKVPAGDNGTYREHVFTMPDSEEVADLKRREAAALKEASAIRRSAAELESHLDRDYKDAIQVAEKKEDEVRDLRNKIADLTYTHGHWIEFKNQATHVRTDVVTLPDGRKILRINELQDDWAQAGRESGFGVKTRDAIPATEVLQSLRDEKTAARDALNAFWGTTGNGFRERESGFRHDMNRKYGDGWVVSGKMSPEDAARHREMVRLDDAYEKADRMLLDAIDVAGGESAKRWGVPDRPLKEGWAKYALRQMVDYAVKNGYDGIAIVKGSDIAAQVDGPPEELGTFYDEILANELKGLTKAKPQVVEAGRKLRNRKYASIKEATDERSYPMQVFDLSKIRDKVKTEGQPLYQFDNDTDALKAAFDRADQGRKRNFSKLSDVRKEAGLSREAFDAALRKLRVEGYFTLNSNESKVGTPEEMQEMRAGGINEGGSLLTWISRKNFQYDQSGKAGGKTNPRGRIKFISDTKALLTFYKKADASTFVHEMAHFFERRLEEADPVLYAQVTEALGGKPKAPWTTEMKERFARQYERYLANGEAPTPALKTAFEKFKDFMLAIYKSIVGTPLADQLDPQLKLAFDEMHGGGFVTFQRDAVEDAKKYVSIGEPKEAIRILSKLDFSGFKSALSEFGVTPKGLSKKELANNALSSFKELAAKKPEQDVTESPKVVPESPPQREWEVNEFGDMWSSGDHYITDELQDGNGFVLHRNGSQFGGSYATLDEAKNAAGETTAGKPASGVEFNNILGVVSSPPIQFGKVGESISNWVKKNLTSAGHMPLAAFEMAMKNDSTIAAEIRQAQSTSIRLRDAMLNQQTLWEKIRDVEAPVLAKKMLAQANAALKGDVDAMNELPDQVGLAVAAMREHIDTLSRRLLNSGVIAEKLEVTIEDNLGSYVTRSYQVFDDPKWKDKLDPVTRSKAHAFLKSEFSVPDDIADRKWEEIQKVAHKLGVVKIGEPGATKAVLLSRIAAKPAITNEEIDNLIDQILTKDGATSVLSGQGIVGGKDLSILKKRKEIAEPIRALLGEYNDPFVNYVRSVTKMAALAGNHQFLTSVRNEGMGKWLFDKNDLKRPPGHNYEFPAGDMLSPLSGLVTTKEIRDAFERDFGDPYRSTAAATWMFRSWAKLNGMAKYGKTVLSPGSTFRNLWSNMLIAVQNGHFDPSAFASAAVAEFATARDQLPDVIRQFTPLQDQLTREKIQRYIRLGVIDTDVITGELKAAANDAGVSVAPKELRTNVTYAAVAGAFDVAEAIYQGADNVWKIHAFEVERSRYKQAYESAGRPLSESDLDEIAAKVVRDTFPNYNMVPRAVKAIRQFPVVGSFVSFPSEIARTTWKSILLARSEINDPVTRSIGYRRAATLALANALPVIAAAFSRYLAGVSLEDDDDLRKHMPSWTQNAYLLWTGKKDGVYTYVDLSFMIPQSFLHKPIMALFSGETISEGMLSAAMELVDPFGSEEILTEKIIDVMRNRKAETKQGVYNEQADLASKAAQAASHIFTALKPGFWASANRIQEAALGEKDRSLANEVIALVGPRIVNVPVRRQLGFEARDYLKAKRGAAEIFTRPYTDESTRKPGEVAAGYAAAEASRRNLFDEMRDRANGAIRLGIPREEVVSILRANNMSAAEVKALMNNEYTPYIPSEDQEKRLDRNKEAQQRRNEFREAAGTGSTPEMKQRMRVSIQADVANAAENLTTNRDHDTAIRTIKASGMDYVEAKDAYYQKIRGKYKPATVREKMREFTVKWNELIK